MTFSMASDAFRIVSYCWLALLIVTWTQVEISAGECLSLDSYQRLFYVFTSEHEGDRALWRTASLALERVCEQFKLLSQSTY